MKSEILHVSELTDGTYFLRIDYEEGHIASAVGHVFKDAGDGGRRCKHWRPTIHCG
jgi:hypothetical protein